MSSRYVVSNVPKINRSRSRFDLSHGHKTSGSVGYLYPLDPIEVLPGDTFKFNLSMVARLSSTLVRPVMDNLFIDVHSFFVPKRLLYNKFEEMYGQASPNDWSNPEEIVLPSLDVNSTASDNAIAATQNGGSAQVAQHFGLNGRVAVSYNEGANKKAVSVLPFRAFAMIYNEFFRDENLISPMNVVKGDTGTYEKLNTSAWSPTNYTGCVPKVSKLHDYFTSVLPGVQKGQTTTIPLSLVDDIPVNSGDVHAPVGTAPPAMRFKDSNTPGNKVPYISVDTDGVASLRSSWSGLGGSPIATTSPLVPINLWASAGEYASSLSVNDLRFAFQYQKMLERQARSGSRFVEWLLGAFGVQSGDARLQRPEYLGGKRIPVQVQQVSQTTGFSTDSTPQTLGQVGANSVTAEKSACRWTFSASEPGYIINVFCVRQFHTYQQGINRMWFKDKRIDFYEPVYANIGEQPVFKYQLYASASNVADAAGNSAIFGYNEAWQEYRQIPNLITGQMNSDASDSLDIWHLGDRYLSSPSLGQTWIEETSSYLDDVLSVKSSSLDQFIFDFWQDIKAIRCMPLYSVPGLIDHN